MRHARLVMALTLALSGADFLKSILYGDLPLTFVSCAAPALAAYCYWPGYWKEWYNVSSCATSPIPNCGTGSQKQNRNCSNCFGGCDPGHGLDERWVSCNVGPARTWSAWGPPSQCSVNCGTGTSTQMRTCIGCQGSCSDSNTMVSSCQGTGTAKNWGDWRTTGSCSTSCGNGTQPQVRSCHGDCGSCPGPDVQDIVCASGGSRTWSAWVNASISTQCGIATVNQTRQCIGCLGSCPAGNTSQTFTAAMGPRNSWSLWVADTGCNATCGAGVKSERRTCRGCWDQGACSGEEFRYPPCQAGPNRTWTSWANASACSHVCAEGNITQQRVCSGCVGDACVGDSSRQVPCYETVESFWSAWEFASGTASCPATCVTNGFRACLGCGSTPCIGATTTTELACQRATWSQWVPEKVCNATCDTQKFTRVCTGCSLNCGQEPAVAYSRCGAVLPPLGNWSAWGCCDYNKATNATTQSRTPVCPCGDCDLSIRAWATNTARPCALGDNKKIPGCRGPGALASGTSTSSSALVPALVSVGLIVLVATAAALAYWRMRKRPQRVSFRPPTTGVAMSSPLENASSLWYHSASDNTTTQQYEIPWGSVPGEVRDGAAKLWMHDGTVDTLVSVGVLYVCDLTNF